MYKASYFFFGLLALVVIVACGLIVKAASMTANGALKTLAWLGN